MRIISCQLILAIVDESTYSALKIAVYACKGTTQFSKGDIAHRNRAHAIEIDTRIGPEQCVVVLPFDDVRSGGSQSHTQYAARQNECRLYFCGEWCENETGLHKHSCVCAEAP